MEFPATLEREDTSHAVTVRASVSNYADAIDCPAQFRSRFAGQKEVEILEVTEDATGKPFEVNDEEHAHLVELAAKRATDERDDYEMRNAPEGAD